MAWTEIGCINDIPRRGARVIHAPQGDIAVFRTGDNQVFALRDRCPHQGGPLSQGIVHDTRVTCPLHNWQISLDSGEAVTPDEGCTAHFEVRVVGEVVSLYLTENR